MAKFTSDTGSPVTVYFFDGRDPVRLETDEAYRDQDTTLERRIGALLQGATENSEGDARGAVRLTSKSK